MLGSIGPAELILLLLIAVIPVGGFLAYRWSRKKSEAAALGMPVKWYFFYTYVRLPLGIMLSIVLVFTMKGGLELAMNGAAIAFEIAVLIGLLSFKEWGLNLNIILLLLEAYSRAAADPGGEVHRGTEFWVRMGILVVIWFVPNIIYFEKRRRLFAANGKPLQADHGDHGVGPQ